MQDRILKSLYIRNGLQEAHGGIGPAHHIFQSQWLFALEGIVRIISSNSISASFNLTWQPSLDVLCGSKAMSSISCSVPSGCHIEGACSGTMAFIFQCQIENRLTCSPFNINGSMLVRNMNFNYLVADISQRGGSRCGAGCHGHHSHDCPTERHEMKCNAQ